MSGLVGTFLCLGNPLLDIAAVVDDAFLAKHDIKLANQILAEPQHMPIYQELAALPTVEYMAGGAGQNTTRVVQWLMQVPHATTYMGCIGDDEFGRKMSATASSAGVNVRHLVDAATVRYLVDAATVTTTLIPTLRAPAGPPPGRRSHRHHYPDPNPLCPPQVRHLVDAATVRYLVDAATPTGTCAVCVVGGERSLVANLAAANNYKTEHVLLPENFSLVEAARIIYCTGFFITVSPDSIALVAKHCAEHDKIFAMNISAPFIVQVPPFKKVLSDSLPYVDYLFGNETEAAAFAESEGYSGADLQEVARRVSRMPKASGARPRTVVFTQGADCTIVAVGGKVTLYPTTLVEKSKLILAGKGVPEAVRAGNYAASTVIQHSGCVFPATPSFCWE
ncbi:MAG: hypothetical protein WDW38_008442 [Sanguina aurantia]